MSHKRKNGEQIELIEETSKKKQNVESEDRTTAEREKQKEYFRSPFARNKLIEAVQRQGPLGAVVIMRNENESPYVTLQNSLSISNIPLNVNRSTHDASEFELRINDIKYASGPFSNVQAARITLAESALEQLKCSCFFIDKKKCYTDVTNKDLEAGSSRKSQQQQQPKPQDKNDSVAHKMMMKMGWSGGGLGAQEQGKTETVTVYENISREGFGSKNIMKEITKVLQDFSRSTKLTTLAFDSDFTKEERELIHKLARKFNLKSKSEGKEIRRLTVSRKLRRYDIVTELLQIGGENDSYKLHVPSKFDTDQSST